jgi:hypothetical protein
LIKATVLPESMIYTDEYAIYDRIEQWGHGHKTLKSNMSQRLIELISAALEGC